METYTKILKGKELRKVVDIPSNLDENDVKVTVEVIENENNKNYNDDKMEKFFEKIDKLNLTIPKDIDVDKIINEMYDRTFNIVTGKQ